MNTLQYYIEIPASILMLGDSHALVESDSSGAEVVELAKVDRDLRETLAGLSRQLESRREELRRVQERFDAASRARDMQESGGKVAGDETEPASRPSLSLLRAEASLAQLELCTVRNQVEYLTGLIRQAQIRAEMMSARIARGEGALSTVNS